MAIDTKSLTEVITEFRALQSKDAISPDSLGYILQRIVDLLATAGSSDTVGKITALLDGFKAAGQAITELSQGKADRNNVYANISSVNLTTGAVDSSSAVLVQQATTDRAGAMRAQQVIDLNTAKKGLGDLQTQVGNIDALVTRFRRLSLSYQLKSSVTKPKYRSSSRTKFCASVVSPSSQRKAASLIFSVIFASATSSATISARKASAIRSIAPSALAGTCGVPQCRPCGGRCGGVLPEQQIGAYYRSSRICRNSTNARPRPQKQGWLRLHRMGAVNHSAPGPQELQPAAYDKAAFRHRLRSASRPR